MRGEDEQIGHSDRASLIIEFSYPVRVVQLHHGEVIFNRQPIEVRKTRTFLDHFRDCHAHAAEFGQRFGNVYRPETPFASAGDDSGSSSSVCVYPRRDAALS